MPSFISPQKSGHKAMSGLALLATTILSVVLAPSAVSASAATSTEKTASNRVTIGESGSTLLEPLFDLWAEAYQEKDPAVTVTPSGGRSGKGISDVIAALSTSALRTPTFRAPTGRRRRAYRTSPWPYRPRWSTTTSRGCRPIPISS